MGGSVGRRMGKREMGGSIERRMGKERDGWLGREKDG